MTLPVDFSWCKKFMYEICLFPISTTLNFLFKSYMYWNIFSDALLKISTWMLARFRQFKAPRIRKPFRNGNPFRDLRSRIETRIYNVHRLELSDVGVVREHIPISRRSLVRMLLQKFPYFEHKKLLGNLFEIFLVSVTQLFCM